MYCQISLGILTLLAERWDHATLRVVLYCFSHYVQTSYQIFIFSFSNAEIILKQEKKKSSIFFFSPQTEQWHLCRPGLFHCCLLLQYSVLTRLKTTRFPVCAQEAQASQDPLGCMAAPVSPAGMDETVVTLNPERKGKEETEENQVQK